MSFLISMTSCLAFTLSAFELYGDEDYVHNYLGCGPNGDTGAIPIMGSISISICFGIIHVIAHIIFILKTKTKEGDKNFKIKFGFYKDEKIISWFIKAVFYLFTIFLIYDYIVSFYKFYLFEFTSFIVMEITIIIYSQTITNLIGTKN